MPIETTVTRSWPTTQAPTRLASPSPSSTPEETWQLLRPGLERRLIRPSAENQPSSDRLYVLRLDPDRYQFKIAYQPGEPQDLATWQAQTGALLVVNGGFFTEEFIATGRVVIDGEGSGVGYRGFAGMLAIHNGRPDIRWLREQPYDGNEPLQYALQSFPVLVKPGGQPGFDDEDSRPSRRTVIAEDRDGRILFILAPWGGFTLYQLSQFLSNSDLDIEIALNLDGGTSTGLLLQEPAEILPSFTLLPIVITVHTIQK